MVAPKTIIDLVGTFKKNEVSYLWPKVLYLMRENTKTDFINPFFEALGWDVINKKAIEAHSLKMLFMKNL